MAFIRWLAVIAATASLAGCAPPGTRWVDASGGHRGQGRAQSDYKACAAGAGKASVDQPATFDSTEARQARLLACMFSHGWRHETLVPL